MIDPGSPLGSTTRVQQHGTEEASNRVVAWLVVTATSKADAAAMFAEHPHLYLTPENAVELMEVLAVPSAPS